MCGVCLHVSGYVCAVCVHFMCWYPRVYMCVYMCVFRLITCTRPKHIFCCPLLSPPGNRAIGNQADWLRSGVCKYIFSNGSRYCSDCGMIAVATRPWGVLYLEIIMKSENRCVESL